MIAKDLESYFNFKKSDFSNLTTLPSVREQIMELSKWQDKKVEEIREINSSKISTEKLKSKSNLKNLDITKDEDREIITKLIKESEQKIKESNDEADKKTEYINDLVEKKARELVGWIVEVGVKNNINNSKIRKQKIAAIIGLITALILAGVTLTKEILSTTQPDNTQANQITDSVNTFISLASAAILGYLSGNINSTANSQKEKKKKELGKYENEVSQASLLSKFGLTKTAKEDIDLEKGTRVLQPKAIKFM